MMTYMPRDWYWRVGEDDEHVWSSARASYVSVADETFEAWMMPGRVPTHIESEDSLVDVLLAAYPAGAPTNMKSAQYAIERHVEAVACARGYSSAVSCASYVSSTNPQWAAEAGAFVAWRDAVWDYAFTELAKVQSAQREVPALDAFLTELPVIEWPE